jgi:hypothetical protein
MLSIISFIRSGNPELSLGIHIVLALAEILQPFLLVELSVLKRSDIWFPDDTKTVLLCILVHSSSVVFILDGMRPFSKTTPSTILIQSARQRQEYSRDSLKLGLEIGE